MGQEQESEPDYRFTLANERTFLAWVRTALAILAGAMVMQQLMRNEPRWIAMGFACSLAVLAVLLVGGSYRQWLQYQKAMRHAGPLPRSRLVPLLAACATVLGMAGMVATVLS
ncbi:DUF202 domain-containing protein [Hydrogenophaga sp.]|uniref:YidH family protein n=1 Tax=Hydrogenophaga sp. TaxID=1904254 RepID=UPI0025C4CC4B|nr:DUF202 domain-containing protein [Hydrogenophaga sp.]